MSDPVRASLVSIACFVRGLPLFFRAEPGTPLRVLGIVALDTLHVLRHAQPMPRSRVRELAAFLDFAGCTNAAWDHKRLCQGRYRAIQQRLDEAGLGACVQAYLARLRDLESRRPRIGGDRRSFDEVRSYREAVARLSLTMAAAIALNDPCREVDIDAAQLDGDLDTLFRILMQCQIIDDVLDYSADLSAGLPSFLTASTSLPQAMQWTAGAARYYAAGAARSTGDGVLPLRVALSVMTALTTLVVCVAGRARPLGVQ